MAFSIGNGDTLRVACRLRDGYGSDVVNVYHFHYTGSATDSAEVGPILRRALDDMYNNIQAAIPSDTTFIDIKISNASTGAVEAAQPWPTQTAGGGTGDQVPSMNTALIVGRTNVAHRIGRKFLGPFIAAANADGKWYATLLTMLGNFLADYLSDIAITTVGSLSPSIGHYLNGTFIGDFFINGGYTSNNVYTQRRRRPGVGA